MKPKNKYQARVAKLSNSLRPLTTAQRQWAIAHTLRHEAYCLKSGQCTCMECGEQWQRTEQSVKAERTPERTTICPACGMRLQVMDTRKKKASERGYFGILTTKEEFQILRIYQITQYYQKGKQASYTIQEAVRRFIDTNGKVTTLARPRTISYYNLDCWQYDKPISLKENKGIYDQLESYLTAIYPKMKLLPELVRNGFNGTFERCTPTRLFHHLLSRPQMETLWKSQQYDLFIHFAYNTRKPLESYWKAIKICIRNNYIVEDGSLWCDYVDNLIHFGKDTSNAHYVCPSHLHEAHDQYMVKRQRQIEQERLAEKRQKAMADEERFQALKAKFFGICFTDGTIQVHVLESVKEYLEEGTAMHHCVFANKYYLKEDSLIFSATIDGRRIETVEVSLKTFKVVQSRGRCNQNSEYHDQIVNLVNSHAHLFAQRKTA